MYKKQNPLLEDGEDLVVLAIKWEKMMEKNSW